MQVKDYLQKHSQSLTFLSIWSVLIALSYFWNTSAISDQIMQQSYAEARANLNKDITFRRWGTHHGGVYVPVTDTQKSVPWLKHVPGRDVVTAGGLELTLLNPASMLTQMMDAYAEEYGIRGRITGLKYLNPGNKPDAWEAQQLEAFTSGERKEVWSITNIGDEPFLRYLRAMYMEPGCDKCHGILGYKTGDMRGATGLNLPLTPYYEMIRNSSNNLFVTYFLIWSIGCVVIFLFAHIINIRNFERIKREKEKEEAARVLRMYANAFESSGDAILIADSHNKVININESFSNLTGYSLDDIKGKATNILSCGETSDNTYSAMWSALQSAGFWHGELWNRKRTGEKYPVWVSITLIPNEEQMGSFYIANYRDVTERIAAQAEISHLAHHDILTGLCNRYSLEERLEQEILNSKRHQRALAVLFIDLDNFKSINDSFGHQIGDQFLVEIGTRLKTCTRAEDVLARIGGDEFILVLTNLNDGIEASKVAEKILSILRTPYQLPTHMFESSASIGICLYPDDAEDTETLLKNADIAMYQAKASGRNTYQFFSSKMSTLARERMEFEHDMRKALENEVFELYYQPQFNIQDRSLLGLEALLRWKDPVKGFISPERFIPLAEETGFIILLGDWVLEQACKKIASIRDEYPRQIRMAVNLSVKQLQSQDLVGRVKNLIELYNIRPGELEFEITETAAMQDPDWAIQQLLELKALGISFAIDDFGTGYSSLGYLKRLPIQTLKLDRTFVKDIGSDRNDEEICLATIMLAHNLGLKVVAEGVETTEQLNYLAANDCDHLQGFLLCKPLPESDLSDFLHMNEVEIGNEV